MNTCNLTIRNQSPEFSTLLILVLTELERAEEKHPDWSAYSVVDMAAIVSEEAGELIRAALQHKYEGGQFEEIKKECIQTAAVALRMLKELSEYEKANIINSTGHNGNQL